MQQTKTQCFEIAYYLGQACSLLSESTYRSDWRAAEACSHLSGSPYLAPVSRPTRRPTQKGTCLFYIILQVTGIQIWIFRRMIYPADRLR